MTWFCLLVATAVFAAISCPSTVTNDSQPAVKDVSGIFHPRSAPLREEPTLKAALPKSAWSNVSKEVEMGEKQKTFQCLFGFGKPSDHYGGKINLSASAGITSDATGQEVLSVECKPPSSFSLEGKCNKAACTYGIDLMVGGGRTHIAKDNFTQYNLCSEPPSSCDSLKVEAVYATHWTYQSHKWNVRLSGRNLGYLPDITCEFKFPNGSVKESRPENRHAQPGLKWVTVGETKPTTGTEINNKMLAEALAGKHEFTNDELEAFQIFDLSYSSCIKVGDIYMKPADAHLDFANAGEPSNVTCKSNGNRFDMFPLPKDEYISHGNALLLHQLRSLVSWDESGPPSQNYIWPSIIFLATLIWFLVTVRTIKKDDRVFWACCFLIILFVDGVWFYLWSKNEVSKTMIYGPAVGLHFIAICLAVVRSSHRVCKGQTLYTVIDPLETTTSILRQPHLAKNATVLLETDSEMKNQKDVLNAILEEGSLDHEGATTMTKTQTLGDTRVCALTGVRMCVFHVLLCLMYACTHTQAFYVDTVANVCCV